MECRTDHLGSTLWARRNKKTPHLESLLYFILPFLSPHPFYMVEARTVMLMGFFRTHSSCSFLV